MSNKYQKVINKMALEDAKRFNISFYSARKSIMKMFWGFKGIPIEKSYKARLKARLKAKGR